MADSSPAMYLVKQSRSALMVLVLAESKCDHEHIQVEVDSPWVPGRCRAGNGEGAQLRYVGTVVLRVFQAQFLEDGQT